jgi:hypothetical protein
MRVFIGGEAMYFPARWYFAPPGASLFKQPHGMESSVWVESTQVNWEWGEVTPYPKDRSSSVLKKYDKGVNPCYTGHNQVGEDQWFIDGQLPADILDGPPPAFCPSCNPCIPYTGQGGLVLGGTAARQAVVPCAHCTGGFGLQTFTVHASGGTLQLAALNGDWLCPATGIACTWESSPTTPLAFVQWLVSTNRWFCIINVGGFVFSEYVMPQGWDCIHNSGPWTPLVHSGTGNVPVVTVN